MVGIVLATHANLAETMLVIAKRVTANTHRSIAAVEVQENDTTASFASRLRSAVNEADSSDGVLILTDMFGGTPSNVALTLHESGHVEVVTGANLPMVVKALQLTGRNSALSDVVEGTKSAGLSSIAVASEVLEGGGR